MKKLVLVSIFMLVLLSLFSTVHALSSPGKTSDSCSGIILGKALQSLDAGCGTIKAITVFVPPIIIVPSGN